MKITLADLAHTYSVSDASLPVPLSIGYVATYAQAAHGSSADITLHKHVDAFLADVYRRKPDLVGLANYGWNENLNRAVGRHVRANLPHTTIVMGGPNMDEEASRRTAFLRRHDYLDYLVIDGGEEPFSELITWLGGDRHCDDLPSNLIWLDSDGAVHTMPTRQLSKQIENIPSPYLSGVLDPFIERGMIPLFETNRGCPFRCSFCAWGMASKDLVRRFDGDTALEEFEYVGSRSRAQNWIICDANFGILKRDVGLAKKIRAIKDRFGAPSKCHVWLSKNTSDRNLEIAEILGDMVVPVMAVQSLDDEVLKNVERSNINVDTYVDYQKKFHQIGHQTYSDMIVPLPAETLRSHTHALKQMLEFDVDIVQNHNLRMLAGSAINSDETREKFDFHTRYRLIHGDAGRYMAPDGTEVVAFEFEESLRSTSSMSEEDLFYLRKIHFLIEFCWNSSIYRMPLKFVIRSGTDALKIISGLLESPFLSEFWTQFENASDDEWFDSEREIEDFFAEDANFQKLLDGDFEKLNIQFSVIALRDFKSAFDRAMHEQLLAHTDPALREAAVSVLEAASLVVPGLGVTETSRELVLTHFPAEARRFVCDWFAIPENACNFSVSAHPERQHLCDVIRNASLAGYCLSKVLNTQGYSLTVLSYIADHNVMVKNPGTVIQKSDTRQHLGAA